MTGEIVMKKTLILAAICFVLTFTACSERPESNIQNNSSPSEALNTAQKGDDPPQSPQSAASSPRSDIQNNNSQSEALNSSQKGDKPSQSSQSGALNTAQKDDDPPKSPQSAVSLPGANITPVEDPEEDFILCFGLYDEETNAVDVYCYSTESGTVSLYENGANNKWTKISDVPEDGVYSYKITKNFKEKKIKAVQKTANGDLESAEFGIVFRDGSYMCEFPDSDNDGLPDIKEKMYGTDPNDPDTDGDGFSDYEETVLLQTDPLVKNKNNDQDGDGLSDRKELELGTDPIDDDTDGDGLSDFDEINKYKTDPLDPDTDGDTLKDGAEIVIGLDPKNPATFGVPDAEYKIKQIIGAESDSLRIINKKSSPFTLSLEITASGDVNGSLIAGRSGYATVIQSDNQIGEAIELKYNGGEIDEVVLHFQIADEYVQNQLNYYPDVEVLQGVNRFNIFKYFEDLNMLLPIETEVDTQTNTITSTVDELGTYCVIDMEKWFKNIEDFQKLQGG